MAPWLIPTLKAVLPHLGTIVSVAKPVFTKANTRHTEELQAAVAQNAAHIRELASALEQAAALADARLRRALVLSALAAALSLAALGVALAALLAR